MTTLYVDIGICLCQIGQEGPGHRSDVASVTRREEAELGSHLISRAHSARSHAVYAVPRPVVLICPMASAVCPGVSSQIPCVGHSTRWQEAACTATEPGSRHPALWTREAVDVRGPRCGVAEWRQCARLGAGRAGLWSLPALRLLRVRRPQGRACWSLPPRGERTPYPQPRFSSSSLVSFSQTLFLISRKKHDQ